MRQVVDNRQVQRERRRLRVVRSEREQRRQDLARLAKTQKWAANRLIKELEPYVGGVARKQRGLGIGWDELVQVGRIGVMKAIKSYTPQRGATFTTYAHWWIHGEMRREVENHRRTIRVPKRWVQEIDRSRKVREALQQELGRPPMDDEVARAMGFEVQVIWLMMLHDTPVESLDRMTTPEDEDDFEPTEAEMKYLLDPTGDPEKLAMGRMRREEMQVEMRKALRNLRDRDRRVVRMRYWDELTRREIAEIEGITQKAVRVAEDRGKEVLWEDKKLREFWNFVWN